MLQHRSKGRSGRNGMRGFSAGPNSLQGPVADVRCLHCSRTRASSVSAICSGLRATYRLPMGTSGASGARSISELSTGFTDLLVQHLKKVAEEHTREQLEQTELQLPLVEAPEAFLCTDENGI